MFVQILLALPLGMVVGLHVKARQASIAGAGQQISVLNPVKGQGTSGRTGERILRNEDSLLALLKTLVPTFANGRGEGGGAGAVELSVAEDPRQGHPPLTPPSALNPVS